MKVYDKEMYNKQESIRSTVIIILVFLIGFVAGYLASSFSTANNNVMENKTTKITDNNSVFLLFKVWHIFFFMFAKFLKIPIMNI